MHSLTSRQTSRSRASNAVSFVSSPEKNDRDISRVRFIQHTSCTCTTNIVVSIPVTRGCVFDLLYCHRESAPDNHCVLLPECFHLSTKLGVEITIIRSKYILIAAIACSRWYLRNKCVRRVTYRWLNANRPVHYQSSYVSFALNNRYIVYSAIMSYYWIHEIL